MSAINICLLSALVVISHEKSIISTARQSVSIPNHKEVSSENQTVVTVNRQELSESDKLLTLQGKLCDRFCRSPSLCQKYRELKRINDICLYRPDLCWTKNPVVCRPDKECC